MWQSRSASFDLRISVETKRMVDLYPVLLIATPSGRKCVYLLSAPQLSCSVNCCTSTIECPISNNRLVASCLRSWECRSLISSTRHALVKAAPIVFGSKGKTRSLLCFCRTTISHASCVYLNLRNSSLSEGCFKFRTMPVRVSSSLSPTNKLVISLCRRA